MHCIKQGGGGKEVRAQELVLSLFDYEPVEKIMMCFLKIKIKYFKIAK